MQCVSQGCVGYEAFNAGLLQMRTILDMEYKRYVNFKQSQSLKLFLNDTFTPM